MSLQRGNRAIGFDIVRNMCDTFHRLMARARTSMTDVLKKAIADSGLPHLTIEQKTGVPRASIMRFMRGEQSLRLDMADRLAAFFGLELRPVRRPKGKGR
jgi:hypothetical protein